MEDTPEINTLVLMPSMGLDCLERVSSVLCVLLDSPGIMILIIQIQRVKREESQGTGAFILVDKNDELDFIALGPLSCFFLSVMAFPLKEWSFDNDTRKPR